MKLYPNATHIYQPADVCLFRGLKQDWNTALEGLSFNFEFVQKRQNFPVLLKHIVDRHFSPEKIQSAFKCCGLSPWDAGAIDYSRCVAVRLQDDNQSESISRSITTSPRLSSPSVWDSVQHISKCEPESYLAAHHTNPPVPDETMSCSPSVFSNYILSTVSDQSTSHNFNLDLASSSLSWPQYSHSENNEFAAQFEQVEPLASADRAVNANSSESFDVDQQQYNNLKFPANKSIETELNFKISSSNIIETTEDEANLEANVTCELGCYSKKRQDSLLLTREKFIERLPSEIVTQFNLPDYELRYELRCTELRCEKVLYDIYKDFQSEPRPLSPKTVSGLPLPNMNKRKGARRKKTETLSFIIASDEYKQNLQAIEHQKILQEEIKKQRAEDRQMKATKKAVATAAKKQAITQKKAEIAQKKAETAQKTAETVKKETSVAEHKPNTRIQPRRQKKKSKRFLNSTRANN